MSRLASRRGLALAVAFALSAQSLAPATVAFAEVSHLPGITSQMNSWRYWSDLRASSDALLADADAIATRNAGAYATSGNNMYLLKQWPEHFNGVNTVAALVADGNANAAYYAGWTYGPGGVLLTQDSFAERVANAEDPNATEDQTIRYAVVTTRTVARAFASAEPVYDDPTDADFDCNYVTALRPGEPLVVRTTSADGQWVSAAFSCGSGWVNVNDIGMVQDRDAWLAAWDFSAEESLVVYGESVRTEDSWAAPATAKVELPQGTKLHLASAEPGELVINRAPYGNYVVWLPTRTADGSLELVRALISEVAAVSQGFVPLTEANIARVALRALGKTYGWGGGMSSNDCSGYVRDVYACFGLELARNTNWQVLMSARTISMSGMSSSRKAALVESLPVGAILVFPGHEMLYLGHENGGQYVVSSISSIGTGVAGKTERVRGYVLSSLEVPRRDASTWLDNMTYAVIPWLEADDVAPDQGELAWYQEDGAKRAYRNGAEVSGKWEYDGGVWYYLDADGVAKTGWGCIDGQWYYFDADGKMQTGWKCVGGEWYLLSSSGRMLTGWQMSGGAWYYLYEDGHMAHDEWVGTYHLASDGHWDA